VILEGREFVWLIADQPVVPTSTMGNAFSSRNVPVKLIIKQGIDLGALSAAKSILPEKFEVATLGEVNVAMAINEKLAGVCFQGQDGKLDFGVGFVGTDPAFHSWCSDLFQYYWTSSESTVPF
jgi:predicted transcriptional regulator